jgi:hypothetical protein
MNPPMPRPPVARRTSRPGARRAVVLLTTAVLATLVPLLAASPAVAATACTSGFSEAYGGNEITGRTGCDDQVPPETTITLVEPAPTAAGFTRSSQVTFTFTGAYTDGDSGPIGFECQLYAAAEPPTQWEECTSPRTYTDLGDTTAAPYTFRVRAVDEDDDAIAACDSTPTLFGVLCVGEEDVADVDPSPASSVLTVDSTVPNTFLDNEPVDGLRPDWPVVLTASPTLTLNSNEDADFLCTLDGRPYTPCTQGPVTFRELPGGSYSFAAGAYDAALNFDPTPVSTTFYVPTNITKSRKSGWKKVRETGLFGNDYLTASRVGATLVIPAVRKVREVRLIAPTGPRFGKVEVRIGKSQWYTVDLASRRSVRLAQLLVRDEFTLKRSGPIQIRVKELDPQHPTVRVDAIVARGDCTSCANE